MKQQRKRSRRYSTTSLYMTEVTKTEEYDSVRAQVAVRIIDRINSEYREFSGNEVTFAQQYILQTGLKKFGEAGHKAVAKKEMKQLHDRTCFKGINISTLTNSERRKHKKHSFS
jgi:hypothetical protein